jgi:glycosyltransferase involved in cell wall biosynthesis
MVKGGAKVAAVCFVGGTRYSQPLDRTNEKKFRGLQSLGELFVIGFSQDLRPRHFTEHAHFYLLPRLPLPILRYAELCTLGLLLAFWLIFRYGVQVLIVQSPYEGFIASLATMIVSPFEHQVALVVESHGDFEDSLFLQRRILFPKFYRFLMRRVAHFVLGHADVLRAVSHTTRQQLEQWAPGKPTYQFPAWTDIDVFLQAGGNGTERACQRILYAGVLTPLKGVHHLIKAFASIAQSFPKAYLVIVGQAENKAYTVALQDQARLLGVDRRVQFVGKVPQVELAAWMRRASVFVLPSMSEGLPRVVVEAMATGTPVIGSNVGGIPEMVEDGATGFLVSPGDDAMLAKRLRWVLEHPEEACKMGRRAHTFAECFFSSAVYLRGYRQIFAAAIADRAG